MKPVSIRSVLVCVVFGLGGCGDNLLPRTTPDASGRVDAAPDSTTPAVCGDGVVTGDEQCDDSNACCSMCLFVAFGNECREATGACDVAESCSGLASACPSDAKTPNGATCPTGFCEGGTCQVCNTAIDADFDGANQCLDCNDTNGAVFPGATESCDGVDDNCNGLVDEPFDLDGDTYSTCSTDPLVRDCNDNAASVHPNAPELCGDGGTGNAVDDNCNGYVDETCSPCSLADADADGITECAGDCDDMRATVGPNKVETCDGLDTDCNAFTTENCGVSDPCNFANGADTCRDDLQCGCVVDAAGQCTNSYRCASFCESSFTGPPGAGCTATQTCRYRWTMSDNQHACAETTQPLGAKLGGEVCSEDNECRSGDCDVPCTGVGCAQKRCIDYCDRDGTGAGGCATGTVCEILTPAVGQYAQCQPDTNGLGGTGDVCNMLLPCKWGTASCVDGRCAQPCGETSHCPSGFHCSIAGNQTAAGTWGPMNPPGVANQPAMETVPVCLADTGAGLHDRPGGASCTQNSDCDSELCDRDQLLCVDACTQSASCPSGLTCEPVFLRAEAGGITWGRACVNASFDELLEAL